MILWNNDKPLIYRYDVEVDLYFYLKQFKQNYIISIIKFKLISHKSKIITHRTF